MNEVLHIEWGTGHMDLFMPGFFPCPVDKFKKILKLIGEDMRDREIRATLKEYFSTRIDGLKPAMKEKANEYTTLQTKIRERKEQIKARKFVNGVPMKKEQVKNQREFLQADQEAARKALSDFKRLERQANAFSKLLQMVEDEIKVYD